MLRWVRLRRLSFCGSTSPPLSSRWPLTRGPVLPLNTSMQSSPSSTRYVHTRLSARFFLPPLYLLQPIFQVVSLLVRCCDVSSKCQSAVEGKTSVLPNPYLDASCPSSSTAASGDASPHHVPLYPLQPVIATLVYDRYRDELNGYGYQINFIADLHMQDDPSRL